VSTSGRTEYITYRTVLVPDSFGIRRRVVDIWGDVVYIETVNTDADLSRLYIGVDGKGTVPASLTRIIRRVSGCNLTKLILSGLARTTTRL